MKEWYNKLQEREKHLVLAGGVVFSLFLIYFMIWAPFNRSLDSVRKEVVIREKAVQWMQDASIQIKQLKARFGANQMDNTALEGQSLIGLIDKTAKANLLPELKKIEPDGETGVRVTIERAPFDQLVLWLGKLETQNKIKVTSITVSQQTLPGIVDVQIILNSTKS